MPPPQLLSPRALLAELDRAADLADSLMASVDASTKKVATFFRVGREASNVSLEVRFLIWSSNWFNQIKRVLATHVEAILGLNPVVDASQALRRHMSIFLSMGSCKDPPSSNGKEDLLNIFAIPPSNLGGLPQEEVPSSLKGYFLFCALGKYTFLSGCFHSQCIKLHTLL